MKIEALLFDLGKVLINFDFEQAARTLHASCPVSREQFEQTLWDKDLIWRYERGEISTGQFHAHLCEKVQLNMEFDEFCRTWSSVFLPGLLVSEELLESLRRNYRLILVSNTNEAHVDYIQANYPIFDYFDEHVFSCRVGSLKPDPEIFEHAIALAGHPPEALFFTDDREENILAASELGLKAHRFVSEPRLVEALEAAGVDTSRRS